MWNEAELESPLVDLQPELARAASVAPEALSLLERPFLELLNLRGDVHSPAFTTAIAAVLGASPPAVPNTVAQGRDTLLLWLGPDEWLLQSDQPRPPLLESQLRTILQGQFASVVDVSSGHTVLQLAGRHARTVLQKGCPLDLHPLVFGLGQCAQSHYFRAGIVLRLVASNRFELIVRRSFADYLGRMLLNAAEEFMMEPVSA